MSVPGVDGPIRVLVADDQAPVRRNFRALVESDHAMIAVGEAGTGAEAVRLARQRRPDVVLMDIRMPGMDGIEATSLICGGEPGVRVLILTTFDLDAYVYAALRAGASGFLLKDTAPAELLAAIRVVAAGDALLAPSVTRRLIAEFVAGPGGAKRRLDGVTGREREVLSLVAAGLSNAEIAARLQVTVATVKTHVSRLLSKLGCRDRTQLVIAAYQANLV